MIDQRDARRMHIIISAAQGVLMRCLLHKWEETSITDTQAVEQLLLLLGNAEVCSLLGRIESEGVT